MVDGSSYVYYNILEYFRNNVYHCCELSEDAKLDPLLNKTHYLYSLKKLVEFILGCRLQTRQARKVFTHQGEGHRTRNESQSSIHVR